MSYAIEKDSKFCLKYYTPTHLNHLFTLLLQHHTHYQGVDTMREIIYFIKIAFRERFWKMGRAFKHRGDILIEEELKGSYFSKNFKGRKKPSEKFYRFCSVSQSFKTNFSGKFAKNYSRSMWNHGANWVASLQSNFSRRVFFSPRLNEAISSEKFKYSNVWELMLF
jgi:hypothetical protein